MVGLDFHGLLLMLALVFGASVFLATAAVQAVIALIRGGRAWRVAEAAALMAGLNVVCLYCVLVCRWEVFMLLG